MGNSIFARLQGNEISTFSNCFIFIVKVVGMRCMPCMWGLVDLCIDKVKISENAVDKCRDITEIKIIH